MVYVHQIEPAVSPCDRRASFFEGGDTNNFFQHRFKTTLVIMQKQNACGEKKFSSKAFVFQNSGSTLREITDAPSINGLCLILQHDQPARYCFIGC